MRSHLLDILPEVIGILSRLKSCEVGSSRFLVRQLARLLAFLRLRGERVVASIVVPN